MLCVSKRLLKKWWSLRTEIAVRFCHWITAAVVLQLSSSHAAVSSFGFSGMYRIMCFRFPKA